MAITTQTQNRYDHRLKELVRATQDIRCALQQGVPPSTARGWPRAPTVEVISIDVVQLDAINVQNEVLQLRARLQKLKALLRVRTVETLVTFYVQEHNSHLPHSAFRGQAPDEMYFGKGGNIPERLETSRRKARKERIETNRKRT